MSDPQPGVVDLRVVVAEIYEDIDRRRAAGEIPAGMEQELAATFAELAPPGASGDDMELLLARAERASWVEVNPPITSSRREMVLVKRLLRKVMRWYIRHLAQQVSVLGGAVVRALHLLDARLGALEAGTAPPPPRIAGELAALADRPVAADLVAAVVVSCSGAPGPVLVAECGRADLVAALGAAGVPAYGVDPRRALSGDALRAGLDVRVAEAGGHLADVAPASLGGVVLTGVVDRAAPAAQLALADLALRALAPGGVLGVVATDPAAWGRGVDTVEADLAPGHPLHASTWETVLVRAGLADVAVTVAAEAGTYVVTARRAARP